MLGVSHGAVQFMAYEEIRKLLSRHLAHNEEGKVQMVRVTSHNAQLHHHLTDNRWVPTTLQNTFHFMGMACLSKLAASVITYPALVLRSRLQIRPPQFTGFVECCTWTWRQQGILGTHGSAWWFNCEHARSVGTDFLPYPLDARLLRWLLAQCVEGDAGGDHHVCRLREHRQASVGPTLLLIRFSWTIAADETKKLVFREWLVVWLLLAYIVRRRKKRGGQAREREEQRGKGWGVALAGTAGR